MTLCHHDHRFPHHRRRYRRNFRSSAACAHGAVTVLEAESALAHHASGRSAAMYEPHYGLPPVVELSLASGPYFRAAKDVLSPRGMMILGRAEDRAPFDHDVDVMNLTRITAG